VGSESAISKQLSKHRAALDEGKLAAVWAKIERRLDKEKRKLSASGVKS
jgi:DNA transposition AAA+ family ATPase